MTITRDNERYGVELGDNDVYDKRFDTAFSVTIEFFIIA